MELGGRGGKIDFNRIKYRKIITLLRKNNLFSLNDLSKLKSLCHDKTDGAHYYKHLRSFLIQAEINAVWDTYKTISPEETWNGKMVSFGLMYSRKQNTLKFPGDKYDGLEAGQILFLNLNLFNNIVHLAVGHEVTGVNDEEKCIKICYLQNGASIGTQKIQLKITADNFTEVVHETWYRSESIFRDRFLYPMFHAKAISEFHNNVKRKAEN